MIIGVIKQTLNGEKRVPLLPDAIKKLTEQGADVHVEHSLAESLHMADSVYADAGAHIVDRKSILSHADIIVSVQSPDTADIEHMRKGAIVISFFDPFTAGDHVNTFADAGITTLSLQMIPRSTINQKMDALSSQANLAGYYAVILSAYHSHKIFPMMTTPAGTIQPARVFVIGAGVAGLQAIATAKRLGARVEAFDTRPVVEEQVKSLGARFVKIDLGETGQTQDGYARALTDEQIAKQREGMKKICAQSDIVITTALVFGKKAPVIVTKDMIESMKPGSVIVDMAVESGGNVEGSQLNTDVTINGVTVLGPGNLPSRVTYDASRMFSSNITQLLLSHWDEQNSSLSIDLTNDAFKACVITHEGAVVHPQLT